MDKSRYVPLLTVIFFKILKSLAQENDKHFSKTSCVVTLRALCCSGQLLIYALNTLFSRICSSPYPTHIYMVSTEITMLLPWDPTSWTQWIVGRIGI